MSEDVREADWFRRMPTGGGTVYARPNGSGNPYARIDEDPEAPRPMVDVELPPLQEEPR